MNPLKKRCKNISIVNKPQLWRSFSVDDIKINKPNKINNPIIDGYTQIKNTHRFNETLLKEAYKKPRDWTAVSGDKMAVAGSKTGRDWYDDVTKIPFWGDVRKSERFSQLNTALTKNPQTKQLIGHSLAGSVILEKQKYNPNLETITYNAPVLQVSSMPQGNRYRSTLDPVSMFDSGSKSISTGSFFNPIYSHSYKNNPRGYASNTIDNQGNQILIE